MTKLNKGIIFLKDQARNNETTEWVKWIVNQYIDQFVEIKQIIFLKDQATNKEIRKSVKWIRKIVS